MNAIQMWSMFLSTNHAGAMMQQAMVAVRPSMTALHRCCSRPFSMVRPMA